MAKYRLEELCEFITDGTHQTPEYCEQGGYLFLSSKDVTSRKIDWESAKHIPATLHDKLYARLSPQKNDILLAKNGTTGVAALVDRDVIFDVYVSLAVLRPKKTVYPLFLLYAINSPVAKRQFDAGLKGIGVPNLHLSVIRKTKIEVPPFEDQIIICSKLDKISKIIEKRTLQINALNDLIKARFVEMFGDPVANPNGWQSIPWEGVFDTKTGKLDSNAAVEGGKYPFFTCAKDWLWIDKYAYDCEALLLAGNNAAGVYDVKHYKGKFNAYQRTYILQLKDVDWSYSLFKYQLEDRLQYLQSQSKGTNTRYLTMGILNSLAFIVPPKEMQEEFTAFVTQVDKSKAVVQKALDKAQLLFDSLMQKYFG